MNSTDLPAVSCYTSTYGRIHCLEELIHGFLNQDYKGKKELVILNDYADQELIFNHPEVVIINSKERITPLGKKFNKNIEYCSHDVLVCMEDDDHYLPHHISYAVSHMQNGIFHAGIAWCKSQPDKLHRSGNYFHATHVFTRELFNLVGGYPEIDVCTVDTGIMSKFNKAVGSYTQHPKPEDYSYIYVWGNNSYHGSGWGTNINNLSELAASSVTQQKHQGKIPTGKVILNPHWNHDYLAMAMKANEEYYATNNR